jgi:hypothetical protein
MNQNASRVRSSTARRARVPGESAARGHAFRRRHPRAGLALDEEAPGSQRFVLRPFVGGDLRFARATRSSLHGAIVTEWQRDDAAQHWAIRVPPDTPARIFVPAAGEASPHTDGLTVVERTGECVGCIAPAGRCVLRGILA